MAPTPPQLTPLLSVAGMAKNIGKQQMIVMAYAPWCPHCKDLFPVLQDVARTSSIRCALFNADRHRIDMGELGQDQVGKALASVIPSFPTLLFFDGKAHAAVYDGKREADNIIASFEEFLRASKE